MLAAKTASAFPSCRTRNRCSRDPATPLAELSGIVTEQGTLPVAAVEGWLAAIKLHPALANRELELAGGR